MTLFVSTTTTTTAAAAAAAAKCDIPCVTNIAKSHTTGTYILPLLL